MKSRVRCLFFFVCFFFFMHGVPVFAYNLITSVEVRQFILNKIYQKDIFENYTNTTYMQNDGKKFSVLIDDTARTIDIIPEQYGNFILHSRSSWTIRIDNEYSIEYVQVHILDNAESYVSFSPADFVTHVSLVLNGTTLFTNVKIPFLFKYIMQLPFSDITRNTRKIIEWDWLFPDDDNFELYASNQSFAAFIQQNFTVKDFKNREYFSDFNKIAQWYSYTLIDFVNNVLSFLKEYEVSFYQFYPLEDNRTRISIESDDFIYHYVNNVVQYLYSFHSLYANFENNIPQYIFFTNMLEELETQLYMWTIRYPQFFYLVLIDELQSIEGDTIKKTVAWRIYIPYITPAGEFDFYNTRFDDIESMVIDEQLSNRQYSYRVLPLKVPFSYDKKF